MDTVFYNGVIHTMAGRTVSALAVQNGRIALAGTEVKSIRMGKCSVKEAFVKVEKEEVWVYGMHISPYEKGNIFNKDPLRPRKLLMHKYEIRFIQHNGNSKL